MARRSPFDQRSAEMLTELMILFSQGDRKAFATLFALVWPVVLQYCRSVDDAEDAAQEALLKVFSRIADYDSTRDGLAWILGIARFEVLTLRKKKKRRREHEFEDFSWARSQEASAEDGAVHQQMHRALAHAIEGLPPDDRLLLERLLEPRDLHALPIDASARKRKQRAVERLHLAWRKLYGD
jgi:RNA polymerase sigma-70 factor, ECF subfamily